jgi:hypothetical protein
MVAWSLLRPKSKRCAARSRALRCAVETARDPLANGGPTHRFVTRHDAVPVTCIDDVQADQAIERLLKSEQSKIADRENDHRRGLGVEQPRGRRRPRGYDRRRIPSAGRFGG